MVENKKFNQKQIQVTWLEYPHVQYEHATSIRVHFPWPAVLFDPGVSSVVFQAYYCETLP